jgi:hypothetical protein
MPAAERKDQRRVVGIVVALTIGALAYRLLVAGRLEHSALLFTGIPAVLAIVTVLVGKPATATGTICMTITLGLCLAGILFGETLGCLLFASPLFYVIGILTGALIDHGRSKSGGGGRALSLPILMLILGTGIEGVAPGAEFNREEVITVTRIVPADAGRVRQILGETPRFDRQLPALLRLRFPVPGTISGAGLAVGAERVVEFRSGGHHPGHLVMNVTESSPGRIRFEARSDDSYLVHWLSWRDATVTWRPTTLGETEVTWTLRYRRRLDPAWYFGPIERLAVRLTAGYLIETVATPR